MSGFENGRIILDEERNIYYAGQVLSGKIEFGLSQPLVFREITVEFHGEATVEWKEIEVEEYNGVRRRNTREYGAKEDYFHIVQCVCGGVGVSQLPVGSHSIPFRFQIPPTAPSHFEESDGQISYWVKACLEYPDGREKVELEEAFEVVVPLDLNANPEMKQPIFMEFEEVASGCCCGSGPVTVQIKLPATGYCPGQAIPVEVNADNQSSQEITKIKFELFRSVAYHSANPQSDRIPPRESLATYRHGSILSRTKRSFTCHVVVPDMIAPVLDNCGIIDVGYFFTVKMRLSGCNNDILEDEAEICLGLIPITELVDDHYTHPMQSDLPKGPIPNLNAPPEFIQPYVYPSVTLETKMQPSHIQNVSHYPGSNAHPVAAYPGNNYPPGNAPYPGNAPTNAPYPVANPAYPGTNPPYPNANTPYPGTNPQYPGAKVDSAPYPTNPPPFAPRPAGFIVPGMHSPGYPIDPAMQSSPYNPSAPSAP